jgi:hypothetical protein
LIAYKQDITQIIGNLRGYDDVDQFGSASTSIEGIVCDGSGRGGDGHIRTAAAGGTAADWRTNIHPYKYKQEQMNLREKNVGATSE